MKTALPPRYPALLRLTAAAALLRLLVLVPYIVAYFLPAGSWFRLILLLCPVLWVILVCPARVRYGEALSAFAEDTSAPLPAQSLFSRGGGWRAVCRGRWRLMRAWALPLCALLLFLLVLFVFLNAFSAVRVLLNVFGGIATALGTVAAFLPRLLMGESPVQPAGALGGIAVLCAVALACLGLFAVGAFRTSAYRFGLTDTLPKLSALEPLRRQNLRLWLPTLALLAVLLIFSYRELGLLFANILGAGPVFSVKLQLHQGILLALTTVSYILLLPLRKYNTAQWAAMAKPNENTP